MRYRLSVPVLPPLMGGAEVERWYVEEGGEIDFGDPVCDLLVTEIYKRARRLQPNRMKEFSISSDTTVTDRHQARVRVLSHDRAVLRTILAPVGAAVREGDELGRATTGSSEEVDADSSVEMRLIAEPVLLADNVADDWED